MMFYGRDVREDRVSGCIEPLAKGQGCEVVPLLVAGCFCSGSNGDCITGVPYRRDTMLGMLSGQHGQVCTIMSQKSLFHFLGLSPDTRQ